MNIKEWSAAARRSMSVKINTAIATVGGLFSNLVDVLALISSGIDFIVPAAKAHVFDFQSMIDPETFKAIGTVLMITGIFNLGLQFAITAYRARKAKSALPVQPEK